MKNTKNEIIEKLKEIVLPFIEDENDISLTDHLTNDLCLDSIDMVDIIIEIEDTFLIKFLDTELDSSKTVSDLVNIIEEKRNAKRHRFNIA